MIRFLVLLMAPVFFNFSLRAQCPSAAESREAVEAGVRQFFEDMRAGDAPAVKAQFLPNAMNHYVTVQDTILRMGSQPADSLSYQSDLTLNEVIREEGLRISVHGCIASAWVPYDLYVNEKFLHCGVNVFNYLYTGKDWKIAGISFTMERNNCDTW